MLVAVQVAALAMGAAVGRRGTGAASRSWSVDWVDLSGSANR